MRESPWGWGLCTCTLQIEFNDHDNAAVCREGSAFPIPFCYFFPISWGHFPSWLDCLSWLSLLGLRNQGSAPVSSCRQWFGTRGFNIVPVVPRIKLQTNSLSAYHHWTTRSFDIGWKPRRPSQFQWTTYYMNQTRHVSKKPLKKGDIIFGNNLDIWFT